MDRAARERQLAYSRAAYDSIRDSFLVLADLALVIGVILGYSAEPINYAARYWLGRRLFVLTRRQNKK